MLGELIFTIFKYLFAVVYRVCCIASFIMWLFVMRGQITNALWTVDLAIYAGALMLAGCVFCLLHALAKMVE